ncbi:MAG TPA: aminoglycoside phosphotransferase family protein [Pseudomonadales bacterium]|nr:aminoglycoside phosphotransferase family protein [Pseudomonadales bacterium]
MPGTFSRQEVERLLATVDPRLQMSGFRELRGGVSARVAAIAAKLPSGGEVTFVARLHGEWNRKEDPKVAEHEFQLLSLLHHNSLPVPEPIVVDHDTCEAPVLIVSFMSGKALASPELMPQDVGGFAEQAGELLASIHGVDVEVDFVANQSKVTGELLDGRGEKPNVDFQEDTIRNALARFGPPPAVNGSCLLHGDYWPGNLLWDREHIVGIIDWEDAMTGEPLADLAVARLEIAWMCGFESVARFTERYRALVAFDLSSLPVWDLVAALRMARGIPWWGFSDAHYRRARTFHSQFMADAIRILSR